VAGGWKRLLNEELHNLYFSLNVIRVTKSMRIIWAGHVARMEKMRNLYRIFWGKRQFRRPRRGWENIII